MATAPEKGPRRRPLNTAPVPHQPLRTRPAGSPPLRWNLSTARGVRRRKPEQCRGSNFTISTSNAPFAANRDHMLGLLKRVCDFEQRARAKLAASREHLSLLFDPGAHVRRRPSGDHGDPWLHEAGQAADIQVHPRLLARQQLFGLDRLQVQRRSTRALPKDCFVCKTAVRIAKEIRPTRNSKRDRWPVEAGLTRRAPRRSAGVPCVNPASRRSASPGSNSAPTQTPRSQ